MCSQLDITSEYDTAHVVQNGPVKLHLCAVDTHLSSCIIRLHDLISFTLAIQVEFCLSDSLWLIEG